MMIEEIGIKKIIGLAFMQDLNMKTYSEEEGRGWRSIMPSRSTRDCATFPCARATRPGAGIGVFIRPRSGRRAMSTSRFSSDGTSREVRPSISP